VYRYGCEIFIERVGVVVLASWLIFRHIAVTFFSVDMVYQLTLTFLSKIKDLPLVRRCKYRQHCGNSRIDSYAVVMFFFAVAWTYL